jgi:SAM-dependent methyltransferase
MRLAPYCPVQRYPIFMQKTTRSCPVCHSSNAQAKLFLEDSIDVSKVSGFSFASRKVPEFMSHRLVRCLVCDVVYADSPPDEAELAHAYHAADYDSAEEADDAAAAYFRAIQPALRRLPSSGSALEIGTGTGAFLEYLGEAGMTTLAGVEPSAAAIAAAPEHRRSWIRAGMFNEAEYSPGSFDLVCCFMTMEHVRDPEAIAHSAYRLLRPGGAFATVTHDYRAPVNRLLGRRSPIIDIEHLQLFSKASIRALFEQAGYSDIQVRPFRNRYSLRYWMRLTPFPLKTKNAILKSLSRYGLDKKKIAVNVGNVMTMGFKQ